MFESTCESDALSEAPEEEVTGHTFITLLLTTIHLTVIICALKRVGYQYHVYYIKGYVKLVYYRKYRNSGAFKS